MHDFPDIAAEPPRLASAAWEQTPRPSSSRPARPAWPPPTTWPAADAAASSWTRRPRRRRVAHAAGHPASVQPCALRRAPGDAVPADPWQHFPNKDAVADYLEACAARFDLPIRLGILGPSPSRGWAVYSMLAAGRSS